MRVAIVWATWAVWQKMLEVLDERWFPVREIIPVASEKSIWKSISFRWKDYSIVSVQEAIKQKANLALFSAGGTLSKEQAQNFADVWTTVVDNSSAWRMDPTKKLIVPEVNAHVLEKTDKIIANPNCSTIQMVVALNPLHQVYGIKRIVVSTYQAVSGAGQKWIFQLEKEESGENDGKSVFPTEIYRNVIPLIWSLWGNGYTDEEMKLVNETRKIMWDDTINVNPTVVRVPVTNWHSESVNIEFHNEFDLEEIKSILSETVWIRLYETSEIPTARDVDGKDEILVWRVRRDESQKNSLSMWIVGDNIRKWAATNAVQIAEYLNEKKWL